MGDIIHGIFMVQIDFALEKIVSMIRKYHNHKLQTIPWHCEKEPHNNHETPGRQTKQSNQPSQNQLCWLI